MFLRVSVLSPGGEGGTPGFWSRVLSGGEPASHVTGPIQSPVPGPVQEGGAILGEWDHPLARIGYPLPPSPRQDSECVLRDRHYAFLRSRRRNVLYKMKRLSAT